MRIHVEIPAAASQTQVCEHGADALTAGAFCAPCVAAAHQAETAALRESQEDPGLKALKLANGPVDTGDNEGNEDDSADEAEGEEDAPTASPEEAPLPPSTVKYSGVFGYEGQYTGDGRYIAKGAIRVDPATMPQPLRYVDQDTGGHDNAYVVGLIESYDIRDNGEVYGEGFIDTTTPMGLKVYRGMQNGTVGGVSMDLDDIEFEAYARTSETGDDSEMPADGYADAEAPEGYEMLGKGASDDVLMHITDARLRSATLVQIPAFATAKLSLTASIESDDIDAMAAELEEFGAAGLPLSDRDTPWDAAAAKKTLGDDPAAAGWAFFVKDGPADQWGSYHLPFAKVAGGKRVAVWRGVTAAAAAVQGARGASGYGSAKGAIAAYYAAARKKYNDDSIRAPWESDNAASADTITASAPVNPPAAWFGDPGFTEPTPLTFTTDGRVYGHIAIWGTCHTGFPGACVTPPKSITNYAYFRTGILVTAEGTEVPVGHLTMATGHAGPNLSAAAAMAHYDNTGMVGADVAAGDDAFGIWVNGAIRPDLTDEEIRELRSAPMSGDWRRIGGNLELMAVLAVNLPGFPVLRTKALVASGATQTLMIPIEAEKEQVKAPERDFSVDLAEIRAKLSEIKRFQLSQIMNSEA